jgi:hypothetical protein
VALYVNGKPRLFYLVLVMTRCVLWDITPCSSLEISRCFEGIYGLHLVNRKKSQERNKTIKINEAFPPKRRPARSIV